MEQSIAKKALHFTPGQKVYMHLQGSGGCMQTGNQKLNTFAYVWMNGLYTCITLVEV